jgi:enterochelin esterase-like enzyme
MLQIGWRFLGWFLALASLAVPVHADPAQPDQLQPAIPVSATLRAGETHDYGIRLAARACAFGSVDSSASAELRVYDAGHDPLRRFAISRTPANEFGFCVENAGDYRLQLTTRQGPANYRLTLQTLLPRQPTRPRVLAPASESPRLRALQARLRAGERSTDAFWQQIAHEGSPLVEALDAQTYLVTFLWRGTPNTRAVSLSWPVWTFEFENNALGLLEGSDVWSRSVRLPRGTRMAYRLIVDPPLDTSAEHAFEERAESAVIRADPYNPRLMLPAADGGEKPDPFTQRSVLELPGVTPETWLIDTPGPAIGMLDVQRFKSGMLGNERELDVYLPAGYGLGEAPHALLILFDGEGYVDEMSVPLLLDSLIAAGKIPPLVALFIRNPTSHSRSQELPCNPRFADFLAHELLPWLQLHYNVTRDPARVAVAGSSFGGLAASYVAYRHPEAFGLVLSQSGSYWWRFPRNTPDFDGSERMGWLGRRFAERERLSIRFYLSAGLLERGDPELDILGTTRSFRDTLRAKGYTVQYQELSAGHDPLAWRAGLPDGLIRLFGSSADRK